MSRLLRASAFVFSAALAASPATGGVVAHWTMSNDFGTVMPDKSGNGNDGTLYDVTTSGSGYIFNGSSSRVVVPHSASLSPGDKALSYTVTFQTSRTPPPGFDYDLVRKGASSTDGGGFRLEMQNYKDGGRAVAYCSISDNAGHTASVRSRSHLADGQLHTVTCTKTGTGMTMTVDGVVERMKAVALGAITNTKALALGCKSPTCKPGTDYDWYTGILREVTISID